MDVNGLSSGSSVDVSPTGVASAVVNAPRQVGQVVGVAVLGAPGYLRLPGGNAGQRLDPSQRSLFIDGPHNARRASGLALRAAAVLAPLLFWRDAAGIRGRTHGPEYPAATTRAAQKRRQSPVRR